MSKKPKVLVGMSGGVDSSLAAALLVETGYDVTGVFMKVWADERDESGLFACPWEQDLADARTVAEQLGIELVIKSVQREYWDRVVADFLAGYRSGRTPNPDVLCNSEVKFGLLYEWALSEGFDTVATGHYAQISKADRSEEEVRGKGLGVRGGDALLMRGIDPKKDQTYFLWQIDRNKLEHILFPIGHLTKVQVREEAKKRGLVTAAKRDSQGICFIGKVDVRQWLREELNPVSGDVVLLDGTVVGRHDGVQLYTLGQRHGFTVDKASGIRPQVSAADRSAHYVLKRDVERNELVVAPKPPLQRELHATKLNWLAERPKTGEWIEARIRHGQQPARAWISGVTDQKLLIEFEEPQMGIASGQSVVISSGDVVLGGGLII